MTNRNPVKQLFITFPHSNVDKADFRDALLRFEPDYYKVCEESHKDGSPHLHAVVRFKNKYSKAFVLKHFKEIYPEDYKRIDVKPVRSIKNSIQYLSKEDTSPLESGTFEDTRRPQDNIRNQFARELGYDNASDLLDDHTKWVTVRNTVYNQCMEQHLYFQRFENYFPEYEVLKILENPENIKQKDDITFLSKHFKIKY